jgi:hypothetical protein
LAHRGSEQGEPLGTPAVMSGVAANPMIILQQIEHKQLFQGSARR